MKIAKNVLLLMIFSLTVWLIPHIDVHANRTALLENENAKAEIDIDTFELYVLEVYNEKKGEDFDFEYPWDIVAHNITSVKFADNVKKVPDWAFAGCNYLKKVDFTGIEEIGDWAFAECNSITEVTLSDIERIGDVAFSGCTRIKYVSLSNVDSIGIGAFMGCFDIEQVELNNIKEMGMNVFYECYSIFNVCLTNVKDIPANGFSFCHKLQSVNLYGVETIGDKAFYDDYNLVSIDLTTVKSLGAGAFGMVKDISINNNLKVLNASSKIKKSDSIWNRDNPFLNRDVTFSKDTTALFSVNSNGIISNFPVLILISVGVLITVFVFKRFISK